MKIAHISTQATWRGGEQQIYYLHKELLARNINSIVLAKENSKLAIRIRDEGLELEEYAFRSAYDLQTAWRIKSYVNKNRISTVHAHTAKAHTLVILAMLLGMKAHIVVSRRVDVPVKNNWFSRFKYNHNKVSKIICVSNKIKEITSEGVKDSSKLITIYSGVDLQKFENIQPGTLRNQCRIKEGTLVIGNVSALADHKDLPTFLQVAKKLLEKRSDLFFVIVGEGEERGAVEEMITALNLKEKVLLTGFRKDVPEMLADIDIFLFTSKTEGLGTTVLDALASKTPVVATRAGGVPEIIEKHNGGILCEIANVEELSSGVEKLLADQKLKEEVVSKGFETARAFSKSVTAERTLALYQSLL